MKFGYLGNRILTSRVSLGYLGNRHDDHVIRRNVSFGEATFCFAHGLGGLLSGSVMNATVPSRDPSVRGGPTARWSAPHACHSVFGDSFASKRLSVSEVGASLVLTDNAASTLAFETSPVASAKRTAPAPPSAMSGAR